MTQRMLLNTSPYFFSEEQAKQVHSWSDVFGNDAPLSLEIGCGTGHFIVERARTHPNHNYIAIDIFNRGCIKSCRRIEQAELTNIRVARVEARSFMSEHLPPGSLKEVFINCPDPWPKKRHRRRRLVNADFLSLLQRTLKPGGAFYFSSDVEDYARDVADLLVRDPRFACVAPEPLVTELPDYPRSKYMLRFLEQGGPIHFVHFQRRSQAPDPVQSFQSAASNQWASSTS